MRSGNSDKLSESIKMLCNLVENLSVHQRQLMTKVEELHAHHEQLYAHQDRIYDQVESLFSIFSFINLRHPLPGMRGWPVSPDFVKVLISLILEKKPNLIVETGSGVSSIITGYCLEKNGFGSLISLEHDEAFAGTSRHNINLHKLKDIVRVVHAPLKPITLIEETFAWYDFVMSGVKGKIDLLIVDGPPGHVQAMARFPALPFFFDKLADDAVIVLDDAARDDEKKVVEQWMRQFEGFVYEYLDTEKGTVILRRGAC